MKIIMFVIGIVLFSSFAFASEDYIFQRCFVFEEEKETTCFLDYGLINDSKLIKKGVYIVPSEKGNYSITKHYYGLKTWELEEILEKRLFQKWYLPPDSRSWIEWEWIEWEEVSHTYKMGITNRIS